MSANDTRRGRTMLAAVTAFVVTVATITMLAAAPAASGASPGGVAPADTVTYPFDCSVIDLSVGIRHVSTTLTLTATAPTVAHYGGQVTLTDVSLHIGPDIAYDLPSQGGLFNTVVSGVTVTFASDGNTMPTSQTIGGFGGQVSGGDGLTSGAQDVTFGVAGHGPTIDFRPTSVGFVVSNVVYWDSFPPVYTCTPTSSTPIATTTVDDPIASLIASVADDVQVRTGEVSPVWVSQHQALIGEVNADLNDPTHGAAAIIDTNEVEAALRMARSVRDLHIAGLDGEAGYDNDAAMLVQLLNLFASRTLFIGGLSSGCGASPPTCTGAALDAYKSGVLHRNAGVVFEQHGLAVAAAGQYAAAVAAGSLLDGSH
jgi:hypothetical protein